MACKDSVCRGVLAGVGLKRGRPLQCRLLVWGGSRRLLLGDHARYALAVGFRDTSLDVGGQACDVVDVFLPEWYAEILEVESVLDLAPEGETVKVVGVEPASAQKTVFGFRLFLSQVEHFDDDLPNPFRNDFSFHGSPFSW